MVSGRHWPRYKFSDPLKCPHQISHSLKFALHGKPHPEKWPTPYFVSTVSLYSSNEAIAFPITTNITFPAGRRGLAPITVFIYTRGLGETFIHVNASTQRSGDDNASTQRSGDDNASTQRSGDENTSTQRSGDVNTSTQRVGEELAEDWYRAKVIVVHSLKVINLRCFLQPLF